MSGHSHAKTVMHKKMSEAEKRGRVFSKIARLISIAAKEGSNPETNPKLRQALDEAKRANMPKDNIERAVKRGAGEIGGEALEEFSYEALGPNNSLLIIEGITDNKNRTMSEIKRILQKYEGKLANEGSLRWNFEQKGIIVVKPETQGSDIDKEREELELKIIEAGAEDMRFYEENNRLRVYTKPEELEGVKSKIEEQKIIIESSGLGWVAKQEILLNDKEREAVAKLVEELEENDSVQQIYSNIKNL